MDEDPDQEGALEALRGTNVDAEKQKQAGDGGEGSDDDDEEQPDYRKLAHWIKAKEGKRREIQSIPARGLKDFEPVGSEGQDRALQESRQAMVEALKATRQHALKQTNLAVWQDDIAQAHLITMHGVLHNTMGHSSHGRSMLYPEEAVYLCERGSLQVVRRVEDRAKEEDKSDVQTSSYLLPMSLQQLWSTCIGRGGRRGLSAETYQVYAYLKRLGYIVIRPERHRLALALERAEREAMTKKASELGLGLALWKRLVSAGLTLWRWTSAPIKFVEKRLLGQRISPFLPLDRWTSYARIFSALRIKPLPRKTTTPRTTSNAPKADADDGDVSWYVYKPGTKYKRTAPPLPDFEIIVVDVAREPLLPTSDKLDRLFSQKIRPLDQISGATYRPPLAADAKTRKRGGVSSDGYRQWKTGSRTLLFALVDQGTTSFFQFGETDFTSVPLLGTTDH